MCGASIRAIQLEELDLMQSSRMLQPCVNDLSELHTVLMLSSRVLAFMATGRTQAVRITYGYLDFQLLWGTRKRAL